MTTPSSLGSIPICPMGDLIESNICTTLSSCCSNLLHKTSLLCLIHVTKRFSLKWSGMAAIRLERSFTISTVEESIWILFPEDARINWTMLGLLSTEEHLSNDMYCLMSQMLGLKFRPRHLPTGWLMHSLPNCSLPPFLHLCNGGNNIIIFFNGLLWILNELT